VTPEDFMSDFYETSFAQKTDSVTSVAQKTDSVLHRFVVDPPLTTKAEDRRVALSTKNTTSSAQEPAPATDAEVSQMLCSLSLNESQLRAVQQALSSHISLIQGPPGTGKSKVVTKNCHFFFAVLVLLIFVTTIRSAQPCALEVRGVELWKLLSMYS